MNAEFSWWCGCLLLGVSLYAGIIPSACAEAPATAATSVVESALKTIEQDAEYVSKYVPWPSGTDVRQVREFALALSAMNFVQQLVSSLQYGYRLHATPEDLPTTVEACLSANAGICGNQVAVYIDLVHRLGLQVRSVEFYWTTAKGQAMSHVGVEVKLAGKWRYLDVTWGAYFLDSDRDRADMPFYTRLLSFEELQRLPANKRRRMTNESALVYQLQLQQHLDPFEYLSADKSVLFGKAGTIVLPAERQGTGLRFQPTNRPNYVGVVQDYNSAELGATAVALRVPGAGESLDVNLTGIVCAEGKLLLQSDRQRIELSLPVKGERHVKVPLNGAGGLLSLAVVPKQSGEPCYFVYDHIDLQFLPRTTAAKPQVKP
ncbi:MAG: transglutaminase domain-containing protein [Nitrospiraceae bacterium]